MRPLVLAVLLVLPLAGAAVAAEAEEAGAYLVTGSHPVYGGVAGTLKVGAGAFAYLNLSGPLLGSYYAIFSHQCDEVGGIGVRVQECVGAQNARFVGTYAVGTDGAALGPASGAGNAFGFTLTAYAHT
ncbi:MAG TPA: hypothetical protein VFH78_13960 [Candidatus Thermoplasmatota archaeon]|nr:hypothetical protein [Candidatus Thermoplasmatota archaeon]